MRTLRESFFALSKNFIAGDFTAVLRNFDLPVAIYADDKIVVCPDIERLIDAVTQYHSLLREHGVTNVEVDVVAVPLMRGSTGTIWVEKSYRTEDGKQVDTCTMRYFFRRLRGRTRISMVEFLKLPLGSAIRELEIYKAA